MLLLFVFIRHIGKETYFQMLVIKELQAKEAYVKVL